MPPSARTFSWLRNFSSLGTPTTLCHYEYASALHPVSVTEFLSSSDCFSWCSELQRGPESGFDRLMRNLTIGHYSPLDKSRRRRSVDLTQETHHEEVHEVTTEVDSAPLTEKKKARTGAEFVLEYGIAKPSPPQSPLVKGPYVPPGERVLSKAGKNHEDEDGVHDEINTAMLQRMRVSIWDSAKPAAQPRGGLHTGQVGMHLDSMTSEERHAFFGSVRYAHMFFVKKLRDRFLAFEAHYLLDFGRLFRAQYCTPCFGIHSTTVVFACCAL